MSERRLLSSVAVNHLFPDGHTDHWTHARRSGNGVLRQDGASAYVVVRRRGDERLPLREFAPKVSGVCRLCGCRKEADKDDEPV
jgi:hypothetical protein